MGPSPADPAISPAFLKLLADEDLAGRTVLDVGTGRGRLALALAPRAGRVVGIDRDEVSLTDARREAAAARSRSITALVSSEARLRAPDAALT